MRAATVMIFLAGGVSAATHYDEAIDGDAGYLNPAQLGTLAPNQRISIKGTVRGGPGLGGFPRDDDRYSFTTTTPFYVSLLEFSTDAPRILHTNFLLEGGSGPLGTPNAVDGPVSDLFFGAQGAGRYTILVTEPWETANASYKLTIGPTPVPVPLAPTAAGLALALAALVGIGRSKSAQNRGSNTRI